MQVVAWSLDASRAEVGVLLAHLSDDERQRAETFTRAGPRRRFIVGRGRLRELLAKRLGTTPAEVAFDYGPAGKPTLRDAPEYHFNLAHSADLALGALSDEPVGIDLERVRPMKNAAGLAKRWFHPDEQRRIEQAADPLAEFFRTWTAKEAVLKLIGVGVGEALPKVLTPGDPMGGEATGLPANELELATCCVQATAVEAGFIASVATASASSGNKAVAFIS